MSRFILPFVVALSLVVQPHFTTATRVIEEATTKALIQTACTVASSPPLCFDALSAVANNPYLSPIDITITAIQITSKTAIATFDIINMTMTVNFQLMSDPGMRKALVQCAEQYKLVIDLMDKTTTALTQKVDQPKIPDYMNAAIGAVAKCDKGVIKYGNTVVQVTAKNVDMTLLIKNALGIYQVFAEYIANPSHDPKKTTIPPPQTGGGKVTTTNTQTANLVGNLNLTAPKPFPVLSAGNVTLSANETSSAVATTNQTTATPTSATPKTPGVLTLVSNIAVFFSYKVGLIVIAPVALVTSILFVYDVLKLTYKYIFKRNVNRNNNNDDDNNSNIVINGPTSCGDKEKYYNNSIYPVEMHDYWG